MSLAPDPLRIGLGRLFTSQGVDPYDEVVWERRDARISNFANGSVAFEQPDVEFPGDWSQNATNIVAQKYFRGALGTSERETSLRQIVDRVVDTITRWGLEGGYFSDDAEASAFSDELKYILVTQRACGSRRFRASRPARRRDHTPASRPSNRRAPESWS